jgi:two-component system heavy metal sensor histidine kinase CusS
VRLFNSLKFRLTVLYAGIFAAFLVAFAAGLYFLSASRAWREFDRDLDRDASAYASLVEEEWRELKSGEHNNENWLNELKAIPELLHAAVELRTNDGKILFRTPESGWNAGSQPPGSGWRTAHYEFPDHAGDYRVITLDLSKEQGLPLVLEFARSTRGLTRYLSRTRIGLLAVVPLLVALAFIAGYFFIKRTIQPVDEMAGLAREISTGDLARRIPLPASEGEFRQLALTLNEMLSRLEEGFARMRTFTSNAAHELKTPVATVRSALETSLGRPPGDMEESIRDALEELTRLSEITEKLFLLARADAGHLLGELRPTDLSQIAAQVASAFEAPAQEKGITINVEGKPVSMSVDAALMRRAIHNLVENAIKYGKPGGQIHIRLGPAGVAVVDDGPGIDVNHLPKLFDRFYRVDPSRSDRVPGAGLGLAIVKSIVEAHGGTIAVESVPGRTVFTISVNDK